MTTSIPRRGPARRLLGALAIGTLAACGGEGNPAGPPIEPPPVTPQVLSLSDTTVTSMEIVIAGVTGVKVTGDTVGGMLGTTRVTAARLTDTTLALLVPTVAAGTHELQFVVGGKTFKAPLAVSAAPVVANVAAYFDSLFATSDATVARLEARLAAGGADTVGVRTLLNRVRAGADSSRKLIASMTVQERAQVASYLTANTSVTAAAAASGGSWSLGASAAEPLDCTGFKDFSECQVEAKRTWVNINIEISDCTRTAIKFAVGTALLGGLLGAGAFSLPAAALGAAAGFALGVALCVDDITERISNQKIFTPVANLFSAEQLNRASFATLMDNGSHYKVEVAKRVVVTGELRSVIASDVSGAGAGSDVARTIAQSGTLWAALMREAEISIPGPTLPAAPARRVLATMPASLLSIGGISLVGATATTSGDDTTFFVKFHNDKQGVDHPVSFAVRYSPAGGAVQERVLGATLDPRLFRVATLAIDSVPAEMVEKSSHKLLWTARDSNGVVIDSTRIEGRKPTWTTSSAGIATVSADGVVTAVDTGTVTITATLENVTAPATIRIVESIVGTYTAFEINGKAVPYTEDDSTGQTQVLGGTIVLNADSTFSYSYSETYTNKYTGITYDEGGSGSGRYVPTGGAVAFTVLNKTGDVEPIGTGGVSNGVMSVTYSGGGTGRLRKG